MGPSQIFVGLEVSGFMVLHGRVVWSWAPAKRLLSGAGFHACSSLNALRSSWADFAYRDLPHANLGSSVGSQLLCRAGEAGLIQPPVFVGLKTFILDVPKKNCCLLCFLVFETCVSLLAAGARTQTQTALRIATTSFLSRSACRELPWKPCRELSLLDVWFIGSPPPFVAVGQLHTEPVTVSLLEVALFSMAFLVEVGGLAQECQGCCLTDRWGNQWDVALHLLFFVFPGVVRLSACGILKPGFWQLLEGE